MGSRWHKTSARTVKVKVASQMILRHVMARVHATMALEVIRCEALWATVKHGMVKSGVPVHCHVQESSPFEQV